MKFVFALLVFAVLLSGTSCAADESYFYRQYDALNIRELEESVPESIRGGFSVEENVSLDEGLKKLKGRFFGEFEDVFRSGLKSAAAVLAIAALCGIVIPLYACGQSGRLPEFVVTAGALAITAACTGSVNTIIGMGQTAVEEINAFSKALLPSLCAAATAAGTPLAATARYTATVLFADLFVSAVKNLFFPMVYAYIIVACADAAIENSTLGKISDFIKWMVSGGLKIVLTAFVAYLSVSGILAGAGDGIGIKTAKFAISGAVPVVGGIIADAAGTVVAGATVMKNAIGVFGMLTILSICLTPFLTLGVNYFLFKLSATVIAPMTESRLAHLVERIGGSFGIVLGMSASCALIMFLSILSSMYAVGVI